MSNGVNDKAFDLMTTAADKTAVDLFPSSKKEVDTKNIHRVLMAAGFTPAWGNAADLVDATLYALEGEFGEAGWALASAIPVLGQVVSGRRAVKAAKDHDASPNSPSRAYKIASAISATLPYAGDIPAAINA